MGRIFDPRDPGDYRAVSGEFEARRVARSPHPTNKASSTFGAAGLRFERRVGKFLEPLLRSGKIEKIEHNPWFVFSDTFGTAYCSPDFILHMPGGFVVVAEVKLTWIAQALAKLNDLYIPIVERVCDTRAIPLVICKNVVPGTPPVEFTISAALRTPSKIFFWPDNGKMQW